MKSSKPYEDKDFPHDHRAIHPDERSDDIKWERARKLVPHASTFGAKIEPGDIYQGSLGDSHILAACSSIAKKDERIKKIFVPEV